MAPSWTSRVLLLSSSVFWALWLTSVFVVQLLNQLEGSHHCTVHLKQLKELTLHLSNLSCLPLHPPPSPSPPRVDKKPSLRPTVLHSTQFRTPMLRIRPQPIETSMMIFNRRKKSQKRYDKLSLAREYLEDIKEEDQFENRILNGRRGEWGQEWKEWIRDAREKEKKEQARNNVSSLSHSSCD